MWVLSLPFASFQTSLFLIAAAGLACHGIFKHTETSKPIYAGALLLVVPACLALLVQEHFSTIAWAICCTFLVYWMTLVCSIIGYRLSPWHPLAGYPGPLLHKISKFRLAFISLGGKQHIHFEGLHARYGDVVRIGPNELSIRHARAVAPVVSHLDKGPSWDGRVPEGVKPLISITDRQEHARRRRPWARAFSSAALKDYEPIINNRTHQLIEHLSKQKGSVDLARWLVHWSFDFAHDLAFGGGTDLMRSGDVDGIWHLLEAGQRNAVFMSHVPWLGALLLKYPGFANDLKAFRAYAAKQGQRRKKDGSSSKDLFYHLGDDDGLYGPPTSAVQVVSDAALAIIAGSDTTSSALANLFFRILTNPTTFKRLQAEVDGLGEDVMDYSKQARLPYVNAVINECLRLHPSIMSGVQRTVKAGTGGEVVGPFFIPEKTNAVIHFYTIQRDPRYFSPKPESFIPERWLSREQQLALEPKLFRDEQNVVLDTDAFVPFSLGPMGCVGKNVALMEMRMMVCMMIKHFDMQLEKGYDPRTWHDQLLDYFISALGELPVVLTARGKPIVSAAVIHR